MLFFSVIFMLIQENVMYLYLDVKTKEQGYNNLLHHHPLINFHLIQTNNNSNNNRLNLVFYCRKEYFLVFFIKTHKYFHIMIAISKWVSKKKEQQDKSYGENLELLIHSPLNAAIVVHHADASLGFILHLHWKWIWGKSSQTPYLTTVTQIKQLLHSVCVN